MCLRLLVTFELITRRPLDLTGKEYMIAFSDIFQSTIVVVNFNGAKIEF